jgi:hypothetical protein
MQLQMLESSRSVESSAAGYVTVAFDLPRFGLSLAILEKQE